VDQRLFQDYIDSFNRDDFAGFGKYYAEDVVFELGRKKQLRGREAILDFYREVKARVRETLEVRNVIADAHGLAAEIATEFVALEDWPDFIAGAMKKGDTIRIVSFVHYKIRDGKFTHIRSTRFQ
jgi:ketosteroid isomerase-like protein